MRRKLPPAVRRAVEYELPFRDKHQLAQFRTIIEDTRLQLDYRPETTAVFTIARAVHGADSTLALVAGAVAPAWKRGWRQISRNEHVSDILDDYFYAMTTYILRSRYLKVTAAIGLTYAIDSTFQYGSWGREALIGPEPYLPTTFGALTEIVTRELNIQALASSSVSSKQRLCRMFIDSLNTLDPQIHRMLHFYLRALRLRNGEFWEDAVISLDSVVDVVMQLVRERAEAGHAHPGKAMISALRLSDRTDAMLGYLRALRNYFGAHPSHAGFWDFGDDYAETVEKMFEAVYEVVWSASQFELGHRIVEPDPKDGWANWFCRHAAILSPTVWFRLDPPSWTPISSAP